MGSTVEQVDVVVVGAGEYLSVYLSISLWDKGAL